MSSLSIHSLDEVDLRSESFMLDPYPTYDYLREKAPVYWSPQLEMFLVTRHDLTSEILSEPARFGKCWPDGSHHSEPEDPQLPTSMLDTDPPDHTRLRRLVAPAFSPRAINGYEPMIERIVADLLAAVPGGSVVDAVEQFALPLPIRVISAMLGLPEQDHERFRLWTEAYVRSFDVTQGPEVRARGVSAHQHLADYFRAFVADRRAQAPAERPRDLLTDLVEAHEDRDVLTESELISMCILLLFAGYETTFSLIANGIRLVVGEPEGRGPMVREPGRRRSICDEIMRFESPVQRTGYIAQMDTALGGAAIRQGDVLLVGLGAVIRDPAVFDEPGRLDLDRNPGRQLALGGGIHYCVGGPLAFL